MRSVIRTATLILICTIILCGCSGAGGSNPVILDETVFTPELTGGADVSGSMDGSNHNLLFYNLIYIDPDNPDGPIVEVIPVRLGELHLNILKFLEVGPCTNCFKIVGFNFPEPGILDVDIEITHPFDDLIFTAFDVRGIMMFNANHEFPVSGLTMSDANLGDGELLNAEGYTQLYNGSTLGAAGDFFTYFKGKFATETVPDADLNGFKRHISDNPANTRNALYAADSVTQTYSLGLPTDEFVIGYAVDASWDIPDADPVIDPIADFPISANCTEPWKVEINEEPVGVGLTDVGGETKLIIDVYDWQGKETYNDPIVECPELFDDTLTAIWLEDGTDYVRFEVTVPNALLAPVGDYVCLIGVEAVENDPGGSWWIDLTAYQLQILTVIEKVTENPVAIATVDPNPQLAELFVHFSGLDSYDPDGGTIELYEWDWNNDGIYDTTGSEADYAWQSEGTYYVQLKVTDDEGETDELDEPLEVVILPAILLLSPNGGEEWKYGTDQTIEWTTSSAIGTLFIDYSTDHFVSDINNIAIDEADDGSFVWTDIPKDLSTTVRVRVSSTDEPAINDVSDADFSIVDKGWARTWGGSGFDSCTGVATDDSGNVYVTGYFQGTVDFDPGTGIDEHTSNGGWDVFLCKYDPSGNLEWALTVGGGDLDFSNAVAVDSFGYVYITGSYRGVVDFDPAPGDPFVSKGLSDIFICKYDLLGNLVWVKEIGGTEQETANDIAIDMYTGDIYLTGYFQGACDFDPGAGINYEFSLDWMDAFLCKLDSLSNYQWSTAWGGTDWDTGTGVATDGLSNVYVAGWYLGDTDFNPSGGGDVYPDVGPNYANAYLVQFDLSGNYSWARVWGFSSDDRSTGVVSDSSGFAYVTGHFMETVDFNPGPGEIFRTSNGFEDVFLTVFHPNGNHWGVQTFGGSQTDTGAGVYLDSTGNVFVTGNFWGTCDFNPDGGDPRTSNGLFDFYLSKFDSMYNYEWSQTWGGSDDDKSKGVVTDGSGNVFVVGYFTESCDFGSTDPPCNDDPDLQSPNEGADMFLMKRLPDGCW